MILRYKFVAVVALSAFLCLLSLVIVVRRHISRSSDDFSVGGDDVHHLAGYSALNHTVASAKDAVYRTAAEDQKLRLAVLKKGCLNKKRGRRNALLRHIISNKKLKFAYCGVGKVASSTWHVVLKLAIGDDEGDLNERGSRSFTPVRRLSPAVKSYFKFVFVRHPFDRLVSAFYEKFHYLRTGYWERLAPKIIRRYRVDRKQLAPHGGRTSNHDVTFDEFVRYLIDPRNLSPLTDFHWSPQSSMCNLCRIPYDFIGHYETLKRDADYILGRLGALDRVNFPGSVIRDMSTRQDGSGGDPESNVNASSTSDRVGNESGAGSTKRHGRTVEQVRELFAELSPDVIQRLKEFYRNDFEILGYDPNIYL